MPPTCEGKDGAVRPAAGEEVGHVAAAGEHKDGSGAQVVGHGSSRSAELLAGAPIRYMCQLRKDDIPMLLLPAAMWEHRVRLSASAWIMNKYNCLTDHHK